MSSSSLQQLRDEYGIPASIGQDDLFHFSAGGNSRAGDFNLLESWLRSRVAQPAPTPGAGRFVQTTVPWGAGSTATIAGSTDVIELYPYLVPYDINVDQVAVLVSTGVSGAQGRVVIYGSDTSGRPSSLLFESAAVSLASTGSKTAPISPSLLLRRGRLVWVGFHHSSTATMRAWGREVLPVLDAAIVQTSSVVAVRHTQTFASGAPATWVWDGGEVTSTTPTAVWLRAS